MKALFFVKENLLHQNAYLAFFQTIIERNYPILNNFLSLSNSFFSPWSSIKKKKVAVQKE